MKPLLEQNLTESIIGAFFDVYNRLGYGLLEQLYATALDRELASRGHRVAREVGVPVFYKGERIGLQRLDLLVDGRIIVEVKATASIPPVAPRQLRSYLHATGLQVGLLLHFGPEPTFERVIWTSRHRPH